MKKALMVLGMAAVVTMTACNGATQKTGGESRDSSASHGNGGPVDTSASAHSSQAGSATSDTSHTGKSAAAPTVDSGKKQ